MSASVTVNLTGPNGEPHSLTMTLSELATLLAHEMALASAGLNDTAVASHVRQTNEIDPTQMMVARSMEQGLQPMVEWQLLRTVMLSIADPEYAERVLGQWKEADDDEDHD